MRSAAGLVSLAWIALLVACGGGHPADLPVDPREVAKPAEEDHVVVGVPAEGQVVVRRGPSTQGHDIGFPRPRIEALRAGNAAEADWAVARSAIDREIDREGTRLTLEVVEAWREQGDALYARVAVEGDVPVRAGVVVGVLARLAALGVPCFDLDLTGGRGAGGPVLGGVERALHWFAQHRTEDGLWARDPASGTLPSVRATSLALAAFVGAGYSFRGRHPFAQFVAQALEGLEDGPESEPGTYAIVAAVLTHFHATTEAESLYAPTARALAALPDRWRREAGSPLATGFAAIALASRRESSPSVDVAFRGELLDACRRLAESRDDLELAVGVAGCVLLGDDPRGAPWRAPFQALLERLAEAEAADPVTRLFATIAAFRVGSDTSPSWSTRRARAGIRGQITGPIFCGGGAWDPVLGRVETTALRALELEIVYRYDHAFGVPGRR